MAHPGHDTSIEEEVTRLRTENAELKKLLGATALNQVDHELENILENMGAAFFSLDKDFNILRVNKLHEKAVHSKDKETVGKNFLELYFSDPATHTSQYWIKYHEAIQQRRPVSFVDYYEGLDIWTDVRAFPTSTGGLAVFYHDITTEKKISIEAASSKNKFEAIFEGSATPLAFFRGPELVYEIYNSKYQELLPGRVLLGKPLLEALPEVAGTAFPNIFKKVLETGDPEVLIEESATIPNPASGKLETRFFDNTVSRINDGTGKPYGIFIQAIEVTDGVKTRIRLEKALAAATDANKEIDEVIEGMSEAFFTLDENWIVMRVNAQYEKIINMRRQDVLGKNLIDLYFSTPEQKESVYVKTYSKVMTERTPSFFVEYYEPFNIWTSVSVYPILGGGIAVFFKEITKEKEAAEKLQNAVIARDQFLSIASHELRTPITGMKLQVQMMERSLVRQDPSALSLERVGKLVRQTGHGLERMNRLVEDMLDISRIDSGKLILHFEPTNLMSLFREVTDRFAEQIAGAGIVYKVLEDRPTDSIPVDRFRIEQVLTNLITNSIRYAPQSTVSINIDSTDKDNITVIFQDSGPGIAKGNEERIFERFERLISANEVSGLGLGLYIVRQIILGHGGTIHLHQSEKPGAKFVIKLPRVRVSKSDG